MKLFVSAVAAGVMIGVGGTVYLAAPDKTVGAVLFSVGLLTICLYGLKLYTGAVGYLLTVPDAPARKRLYDAGVIWLGNLCGTALCGLLVNLLRPELAQKAAALCQGKLDKSLFYALVMGVFCGLLMYLAVDVYKKQSGGARFLGIFLAVPVFILAGFEHSVADMAYFAIGYGLLPPPETWIFLLTVTLGNTLGSALLPLTQKASGNG